MDESLQLVKAKETALLEGYRPTDQGQSPCIEMTDYNGSNINLEEVKEKGAFDVGKQEGLFLLENASSVSER